MKYIENIIIGNPQCDIEGMFSLKKDDWEIKEKEKTYFTNERFLPRILVDIGIYPSIGEIRRNKPKLIIQFDDKLDFIDGLKVSKKRWVWILVGKEKIIE